MLKIIAALTITLLATVALPAATAQESLNLLSNGHFQQRAQIQTIQVHACNDQSSATGWTTWIAESAGCVTDSGVVLETDLLLGSRGLFTPSEHLIHVRTEPVSPDRTGNPAGTGLVNVFATRHTGHYRVLASVWVYVIRGHIAMGTGDQGSFAPTAPNKSTGKWEQLVAVNHDSPANEFVLYSTDTNGAEFYADNAIVCAADTDIEMEACQLLISQAK